MDTGIVPQVPNPTTDFVPEVFGRLTTLDAGFLVSGSRHRRKYHMVRCVCGTVKQVLRCHLVAGRTRSCGCLNREATSITKTTHGHSGGKASPEYRAYYAMVDRCANPKNKRYKDYGGRGIGVFPDWLGPGGFELWLACIGLKPSPKMTQDRFPNPDGNYEPGNVRWATIKEQNNNKRNSYYIEFHGTKQTITQWAESTGICLSTLYGRLETGRSVEAALTTFARNYNKATKANT